MNQNPRALTIAGFDPSGGAGVLADVRTFGSLGCEPAAVITSITYQNAESVFGATHQTAANVRHQLTPLMTSGFACAKTGMLPTREVVEEVARLFTEFNLPAPIVDPVMVASSSHVLMEVEAIEALISDLLPLSQLITPNIPEAERLTSIEISSEADMVAAAAAIRKLGARAVLIKGGHLRITGRRESSRQGSQTDSVGESIDVLDNNGAVTVFRRERISNVELHGTGCTLSAAIAAGLARNFSLEDAVGRAKDFVFELLEKSGRSTNRSTKSGE